MHKVLALVASPAQAMMCRRLAATGYDVQSEAEVAPLLARALTERPDGVLVGLTQLDGRLAAMTRSEAERLILLAEPSEIGLLEQLPYPAGAVLLRPREQPEELIPCVRKHVEGDLLGLEKYLSWGCEVHRLQLLMSDTRGDALDELDRSLAQLGLDPRLVGHLLTITDEFITNAFYNAPVDETGRRRYAHLSRIEAIPTDHPVELAYACDARYAAVSVKDGYGSFDESLLLRYLGRAMTGQPTMNLSGASAGMGLATAYQASSLLVFNLVPGKATECIGLVEIGGGYRQFIEHGKSCQIFHRGALAPKART